MDDTWYSQSMLHESCWAPSALEAEGEGLVQPFPRRRLGSLWTPPDCHAGGLGFKPGYRTYTTLQGLYEVSKRRTSMILSSVNSSRSLFSKAPCDYMVHIYIYIYTDVNIYIYMCIYYIGLTGLPNHDFKACICMNIYIYTHHEAAWSL